MNPTVDRKQRHTRANPCPVCDGYDEAVRGQGKRCSGFTTADGQWCNCSRDDCAGGIAPNAGGLYGHRMRGPCKCGTTHGAAMADQRPRGDAIHYVYQDARGRDQTRVTVIGHGKGKKTYQNYWDGMSWVPGRGGKARILYRLPELLATPLDVPVYVVEGERDVETLRKLGKIATTNAEGAGKWRYFDSSPLQNRTVIVICDKDGEGTTPPFQGQKHALDVQKSLGATAKVTLWQCPKHKDITDHVEAGGTLDDLVAMVPPPAVPARSSEAATGVRHTLSIVRDEEPLWGDEEPPHVNEGTRPEIVIGPDVHVMVDQLEGLMAERDTGLYQRAHELVVAIANTRIGIGEGAPVIHAITKPLMLERITRHVQFVRVESPTDRAVKLAEVSNSGPPRAEKVRCMPPDTSVVAPFCARKHWPHIRHLVGITETPVLRPDGTVCQTPGYDAATGYLYAPSCEFPAIPASPTQADAIGAMAQILDVFSDFPYDSQESRLVPLAAILSIFGRPAIAGGVPAFLFDATVRGSGKTLQCDAVHVIATGRVAPHATWSQDDEEQRKVIGGFAALGPRAVLFDNVKGVFGGQFAEAALTSDIIQIRELGSKSIVEYPWSTVVMVSGNNLQMTDDMLRRSLVSRLETPFERPEDRPDTEFAHPNLLEWVRAERPRLVAAALTMLRAYAAKGWPDTGARKASYQSWAKIVAGTIAYARGGDVTLAAPKLESAAADDVTYAHVVATRLGASPVPSGSLKEILSALYPTIERGESRPKDMLNDLREAIEGLLPIRHGTMPDPRALGKKLRPFVGRWFGRHKLVATLDRTHTLVWSSASR